MPDNRMRWDFNQDIQNALNIMLNMEQHKRQQQEDIENKKLKDLQIQQMLFNLTQARQPQKLGMAEGGEYVVMQDPINGRIYTVPTGIPQQPQATYQDIYGQVPQVTGMNVMPNISGMGGIGGGIPMPIPEIGQGEPTQEIVAQRKAQYFPKTTPEWVRTEEKRRFKEKELTAEQQRKQQRLQSFQKDLNQALVRINKAPESAKEEIEKKVYEILSTEYPDYDMYLRRRFLKEKQPIFQWETP